MELCQWQSGVGPHRGVACGGLRLTCRVGKVSTGPELPRAASRGGAAVLLPPELAAAALVGLVVAQWS
jgi:hypothetical protein